MSEVVCIECKSIGWPKMKRRGSGKIELMGWMLFPLGVPYTIWRLLSKREPACRSCGSTALLPADSAAGQRLVQIAVGEPVTPVIPKLSNEDDPSAPTAQIEHPLEPVLLSKPTPPKEIPTHPSWQPQEKPVQEPIPAAPPIDDAVPSVQPEPPPAPKPPAPPAQVARNDRLDPNVW